MMLKEFTSDLNKALPKPLPQILGDLGDIEILRLGPIVEADSRCNWVDGFHNVILLQCLYPGSPMKQRSSTQWPSLRTIVAKLPLYRSRPLSSTQTISSHLTLGRLNSPDTVRPCCFAVD